ncbi:16S rRNA (uracil(1498)-N(3))-methyltransferase [Microbacterium sp. ZXX196]|uniref:16S rRNA (uracil(1498)-N(3))-methyltransferase n=1 Tax=Microbacterium sp. ZXX196 TaxID=2609291 RepID=UPI001322AD30|nr:16S rRNA (uracil(1498)-N(3))-methyltransferase [Microbacterium sp. ZXX196]
MALHFVVPGAAGAAQGGTLALEGAEAHHAASVRRVRPGERVTATDGRGAWVEAEVRTAARERVELNVLSRTDVARDSPRIALAQALAKGDRDELAVQAATELGVDEIVPWQAARSVSRWQGPKAEKGRARWETIVREAAKQAHRAWIPEVAPVATTAALAARAASARILVLDPWADDRLAEADLDAARDLLLVVGPEGGIAPEELEALGAAGAERVRLGTGVLRTSTAGPAAIAVLSVRGGRW